MDLNVSKWLALLGLAFFISACSQNNDPITLAGNTMGTTYHITVVPNEHLPPAAQLQQEIDGALVTVNAQMSTYQDDSELSVFNRLKGGEQLSVSTDLIKVIKEGVRAYHQTNGALDISLGPLVNLWGFGPDKRPTKVPTKAQIAAAKSRMGMDKFSIDGNTLSKHDSSLYLDLSSIAKGFGVDKVAELLDKHQVSAYLVEIGGELRIKGTKADGSPWRIAIEKPQIGGGGIQQIIEPGTMAMATSGDYLNYYEEDGKRFSHIIDPRSGYPIEHKLASVTVLDKSCMVADGYATAIMVMGTEEALQFANTHKLPVMLIDKQADGFKVFYSDAFKPYLEHSED